MSSRYWPEISFYIKKIEEDVSLLKKRSLTVELIEDLRKGIVEHINELKYSLLETIEDHPASLILFALAAALDEEIQRTVSEGSMHWPPLSKEFYGDYTAGELFYRCIDEILENQKMPLIVFEVFYYALKRGFKGQYRDSKIQIAKYLDLLEEKIPDASEEQKQTTFTQPVRRPLARFKPKHYYRAGGLGVFLLWLGLYLTSNWL